MLRGRPAAAVIYTNCSWTVYICPAVLRTEQDGSTQRVLTPSRPLPVRDPLEIQVNEVAQFALTLAPGPTRRQHRFRN